MIPRLITTLTLAFALATTAAADDFPREGTKAQRARKAPLEGKAPPPLSVTKWQNIDGEALELDPGSVRDIHRSGGTVLGTSRGRQSLEELADGVEELGLDALLCIGGDGTLKGALELDSELRRRGSRCATPRRTGRTDGNAGPGGRRPGGRRQPDDGLRHARDHVNGEHGSDRRGRPDRA